MTKQMQKTKKAIILHSLKSSQEDIKYACNLRQSPPDCCIIKKVSWSRRARNPESGKETVAEIYQKGIL